MKAYTTQKLHAPSRTLSHRHRILDFLRERGLRGVLGSELYARPELYGRSPRNRISELRKLGLRIEGEAHGGHDWKYWLLPDCAPEKPRSAGSTDLPLFAEIQA